MPTTTTTTCRYCADHPAIRRVDVLVGQLPPRQVTLLIDVEPHEDGRVIERLDGAFRLLGDVHYRKPGVDGFRVHGRSMWGECEGWDGGEE